MGAVELEWKKFEQQAILSPYQKWDVIHAWLETVGLPKGAELVLISIRLGDELVALLPFMLSTNCGLRVLSWFNDPHLNYQGGLWSRQFLITVDDDEMEQVWNCVKSTIPKFDYMALTQQLLETAGLKSAFSLLNKLPSPNVSHQLILHHHDYDQLLLDTRSKSTRKRYRNIDSRLQKIGQLDFRIIKDDSETTHFIHELFEQRKQRFDELGISTEENQQAYEEFYQKLVEVDNDISAYVSILALDGEPLSIGFILEHNGEAHALLSSMTTTPLCKHSPGETLLRNEFRYHCENELTLVDFGVGSAPYKKAWCNNQLELFDCYQANSVVGHLAIVLLRIKSQAKSRIKNSQRIWKVFQKVRTFLGKIGEL